MSVSKPWKSPLAHARGHTDTPLSTSVDTAPPAGHGLDVDKKPHKVEEPQAPYAAQKPAKAAPAPESGPRYASLDKVRATNAKLIQVHKKVLQKLAQ